MFLPSMNDLLTLEIPRNIKKTVLTHVGRKQELFQLEHQIIATFTNMGGCAGEKNKRRNRKKKYYLRCWMQSHTTSTLMRSCVNKTELT